jgi:hypothetical protein
MTPSRKFGELGCLIFVSVPPGDALSLCPGPSLRLPFSEPHSIYIHRAHFATNFLPTSTTLFIYQAHIRCLDGRPILTLHFRDPHPQDRTSARKIRALLSFRDAAPIERRNLVVYPTGCSGQRSHGNTCRSLHLVWWGWDLLDPQIPPPRPLPSAADLCWSIVRLFLGRSTCDDRCRCECCAWACVNLC